MKLQRGFSVLELIMVIAVSAIIMTTLLAIYNQVTRNMVRVERFVFEDTQILTLKNRLGKDLFGLCAIWFTQEKLEAQQAAKDEQKSHTSKEKIKTSQFFYSVNKQANLDLLTFVTTSALQSYGSAQSRFIRVVYQVELDPKHERMFRLMRKEIANPTENIDEQTLKAGKFYELVGGIKSVEMNYQLIDKVVLSSLAKATADAAKDISTEKEEQKSIIRSVKQWTSNSKKSSKKNDKNKQDLSGKDMPEEALAKSDDEVEEDLGGAVVPKFVTMKIVFGATDKQLEKEYNLTFCIPSTIDNVPALPAKSSSKKPEKSPIIPGGMTL